MPKQQVSKKGQVYGFLKEMTHSTIMAYFHCRTQIRIQTRTRTPVLCRIFPLVQIWTLDPLIEIYVIGMEICPWHRDPSLKWVQYPFGKGI